MQSHDDMKKRSGRKAPAKRGFCMAGRAASVATKVARTIFFIKSRAVLFAGLFLLTGGSGLWAQEVEDLPAGPAEAVSESEVFEPVIEVEVLPPSGACPRSESLTCPATAVKPGYVRPSDNLAELLESRPGVMVHEAGGEEGPWFLSVRGAGAGAVAVYLDGILLSDPLGHPLDLSGVPLDLMSNLLVYRGYAPPRYPSPGTAGVVEFQMVEPSMSRAGWARTSADSLGALAGSFFVTGEFEGGAGVSAMAARGGPGRFEFEDDRTGVRSNNHHFAYDFMARGERRVGGSRVYAGAYRHYRRRHLPGEDWMEAKRARQNRELTLAYAGVRRPGLLTPDLDGEARAHFLQQRVWLVDDEGELGPPRDELMVWTRFGGDFHLDFYGLPNHQLALYVSFYEDDCRPESKLDDEVEKLHYRRSSMFITLSDQVWFLDGRLRVTPSVRYFHHDHQYDGPSLLRLQGEKFDRSSFTTATADVFLTYQLADGLWLTASVAQYYRPPSLLEEFGDRTRLIGNPDLTPERSMVEQAGLLYRPGPFSVVDDLRVELTVFHHQSHHLIAWQEAGEGRLRAENSGDARSVGVELSASLNLQDLLIVEAAYTFQETENLADDKEIRGGQLPGAPRNTAYLSAIVRRASGQVFYTLNYQDQRYLDPQNRISADPRLIHNLGVIYYRGRFSVGAEAVNIGNDRGPEVLGYPLPGTRYLIFMEVKI